MTPSDKLREIAEDKKPVHVKPGLYSLFFYDLKQIAKRCYRQLFPKVKFVDEIPQWIISSDIAAYHPYTKTIWIRNNLWWKKTILILLHELTHWFIHVFLNNNELYHNKIDKK